MHLSIKNILPIWWSFVWRYLVYEISIAVFGTLLGILVKHYAREAGWSTDEINGTIDTWSAWGNAILVEIPVSLFAFQQALLKHSAQFISVHEKTNYKENSPLV
jgi:hypothetical protein